MARKKILWLCSWYPSKTEPFNGDFVQRHARAAALYNDIFVIHVTGDLSGQIKNIEKETRTFPGLTENIIYYKRSGSFPGKLKSHYQWLRFTKQAIRDYINENGVPDLVHVHIPIKSGLAGIWIKRKYHIPYFLTEHWGIYNEVLEDNYASRSFAFKKYTKKIVGKAAGFISVSKYLAEGVNRFVIKKDYTIIPNVADTRFFYYREKPVSPFRFIHVSNMVPLKNAEGILRAFSLLLKEKSDAVLVMVGDKSSFQRDLASDLGIPPGSILFRGEIPYEKVAIEMQRSDCFVLFSNIENSPCVIAEALCCGLPVIATSAGGIPELVNSTNGVLIEPKDERALAGAMKKMMDNYSMYNRDKIAEDAIGKFSYPVIGKKMDDIYQHPDLWS
jgi:glycosyltransferase involved in cell wall biosynthesis